MKKRNQHVTIKWSNETQTCIDLWALQKKTKVKGILDPNCDQSGSKGSQIHPNVGRNS